MRANYSLILSLAIGISLGIGAWHPWLWWSVLLGLSLLLHLIWQGGTWRQLVWCLLIVCIVKAAGGAIGIWYIYPFDWIGISDPLVQISSLATYWIAGAVAVASGSVLVFLLYAALKSRIRRSFWLALFPAAVVAAEIAGSFTASLFYWGPGSGPHLHYAMDYVGYALGHSALVSLAQFGGVYLLSAVAAAVASGLYFIWHQPTQRLPVAGGVLALVIVIVVSNYLLKPEAQKGISVIAINTSFSADELATQNGQKNKRIQTKEAVTSALTHQPDYVVLPEDSRFTQGFLSPQATLDFLTQQTSSTILIDSARTYNAFGEVVLRAYIYDVGTDAIYTVDKEYLVPGGEFIPHLVKALLNRFYNQDIVATIERRLAYRPGAGDLSPSVSETVPQILFCSELVSPLLTTQRQSNRSALFIAHLVSHRWFHNPIILTNQTTAMLRVQAVWSGTPIVIAGNQTDSFLINASGQILTGQIVESRSSWQSQLYKL